MFKELNRPISLTYFEMHAHEIETVKQILVHLETLGKIHGVNAVDVLGHGSVQ